MSVCACGPFADIASRRNTDGWSGEPVTQGTKFDFRTRECRNPAVAEVARDCTLLANPSCGFSCQCSASLYCTLPKHRLCLLVADRISHTALAVCASPGPYLKSRLLTYCHKQCSGLNLPGRKWTLVRRCLWTLHCGLAIPCSQLRADAGKHQIDPRPGGSDGCQLRFCGCVTQLYCLLRSCRPWQ